MGIGLQVRAVASDDHTSKDFDIIHLVKDNKDSLLNRTKFLFPHYHFDLFYGAIDISAGYVSWRMFYLWHLSWMKNSKKTFAKLTYNGTHSGNNKQDVSLASAVFDETTPATIKIYYPNTLDTTKYLNNFHTFFVICNFKQ